MAVHVFGDSHAHYIFSRCPEVTTFWLGPTTMHRVGRDGAAFVPHLSAPKPEDAIVLVFGEIDVRCHIARIARLQGRHIEVVIGELVDRYVAMTRLTLDHFGIRSRVFMLGAPPPLDPLVPNPRLPVHGPLDERVAIRRRLNHVLEGYVGTFGITYVPISTLYEEPDGSMRVRLSDGHAHIAMDHAHHVCRQVGEQVGAPLTVRRPSPVARLCLEALRYRALKRRDTVALWDLGKLEYGPWRKRAAGRDEQPPLAAAGPASP